jgi:hypothetical protein
MRVATGVLQPDALWYVPTGEKSTDGYFTLEGRISCTPALNEQAYASSDMLQLPAASAIPCEMLAYCRVFRRRQSRSMFWRMPTVLARSGIIVPDVLSRCAITGTTGYIGGYLSHYLQDRGMQIIELRRIGVKSRLRSDSLISLLNQITQVTFSGLDMLERQGCFFREFLGQNEGTVPYGGAAYLS